MILHEDSCCAATTERALAALAAAGVSPEMAGQCAFAAGLAAETNDWPQAELELRLARTLHKLGQTAEACALLAHIFPRTKDKHDAEKIITAPPELFPLIRAGALRHDGEDSWILDAAALQKTDTPLELSYALLFEVFASNLLPLWSGTNGRGTLSLAGWRKHAETLSPNPRDAARRCRAWRRDLADALHRKSRTIGWPGSPTVVLAEPV